MTKLLLIFTLFFTYDVLARTTLEQILNNKPGINIQYAQKIAEACDRYADVHKVPANVLASIAMVESSYILNAVNSKSKDYGLMQINTFNIKAYKFSVYKLRTNIDYSVEAGAIVFKWFYKTYPTLEEAVKRYNAGTAKRATKWKGPVKYWKKVQKYM